MNKKEKYGLIAFFTGLALIIVVFTPIFNNIGIAIGMTNFHAAMILILGVVMLVVGAVVSQVELKQRAYEKDTKEWVDRNNEFFCPKCAEFMNKNKLKIKRI